MNADNTIKLIAIVLKMFDYYRSKDLNHWQVKLWVKYSWFGTSHFLALVSTKCIFCLFRKNICHQLFHVTLILCPSNAHKHGVSIQSSINLGNTVMQIMHE